MAGGRGPPIGSVCRQLEEAVQRLRRAEGECTALEGRLAAAEADHERKVASSTLGPARNSPTLIGTSLPTKRSHLVRANSRAYRAGPPLGRCPVSQVEELRGWVKRLERSAAEAEGALENAQDHFRLQVGHIRPSPFPPPIVRWRRRTRS